MRRSDTWNFVGKKSPLGYLPFPLLQRSWGRIPGFPRDYSGQSASASPHWTCAGGEKETLRSVLPAQSGLEGSPLVAHLGYI